MFRIWSSHARQDLHRSLIIILCSLKGVYIYINVSEQHTGSIFRVPFVITDSPTIQGDAKVTWHHLLSLNIECEITYSLPCTNKTAYYIPCRYVHKLYMYVFPSRLDNLTAPRPPHWAHLWTGDQPVAKTSTLQHITLTRYRHPCPRRKSNPQYQQATGSRTRH